VLTFACTCMQFCEDYDVVIEATPASKVCTTSRVDDDKCVQIRSRAKSRNRPEQAKTRGRLSEPRKETFYLHFYFQASLFAANDE